MKSNYLIAMSIAAGLMSSAVFAGYDTRGMAAPVQCNSLAYFESVHNQCMAQIRANYPEPWQSATMSTIKRSYLKCEKHYLDAMCGNGYPQQRF